MRCPKGQFLATIRNANEVFMNLIGSSTTYIANRRAIVLWNIVWGFFLRLTSL